MHVDELQQSRFEIWGQFKRIRSLMLTCTMVTLLGSNFASLVNVEAHEWMHSALLRIVSIGGQSFADGVLKDSPKKQFETTVKTQTADLEVRNKHLTASNQNQAKQLDELGARNRQLVHQLDVNGKQAKATVAAVHQRLAKGVSRNVAALPSEAVPYLGLAVTVAVTSLDIYDACQTMKDFNALLKMLGQGEEQPALCGRKVPTVEQVLASAKTGWRTSVQQVAEASKSINVAMPEVRLPTRSEVTKASCAAVSIPVLCSGGD